MIFVSDGLKLLSVSGEQVEIIDLMNGGNVCDDLPKIPQTFTGNFSPIFLFLLDNMKN